MSDEKSVEATLLVTSDAIAQLRGALNVDSDGEISVFLSAVATVAGQMFLDELLGARDYPTKTAARHERIRGMVKHAFNDEIPPASVIAALFHVTPSAAATLLASTEARYATDMSVARNNAIRQLLSGALTLAEEAEDPTNNLYHFRCRDASAMAAMKQALADSDETVVPITKSREATNTYEVHGSALPPLSARFGVDAIDMVRLDDRERVRAQVDTARAAAGEAAPKGRTRSRRSRGSGK
ncbi:hypothetical protein L615_001200000030 [Nocardioides sp. J9]|uniref:hypothetical protein n=1 Tax=Nocardioides sp. J9 TaxID=935844 RepID=UPI0011A01CC1|nr:hypothetical protein [Nocardioides sp. J9]TWH03134.1 hypothetical protein L615_001200000030 [Nocardioides sp. J9]